MKDSTTPDRPHLTPRLFDLMVKHATEGVNDSELRELMQVETIDPQEIERVELTVASADLAMTTNDSKYPDEPSFPVGLREKLEADADHFFRTNAGDISTAVEQAVASNSPEADSGEVTPASPAGGTVTRREVFAYAIAAASLLLVFSGYNPLAQKVVQPEIAQQTDRLDPQQQLTEFLKDRPEDLVEAPWTQVADQGASGRVLWSEKQQRGFMVFQGMKSNDPEQQQYQLWIFDDPDQDYPVDGGVFDIARANVKTVVPIDAKIQVRDAMQFAVTVEKPGGVVVSKRQTIPVLAKLTP